MLRKFLQLKNVSSPKPISRLPPINGHSGWKIILTAKIYSSSSPTITAYNSSHRCTSAKRLIIIALFREAVKTFRRSFAKRFNYLDALPRTGLTFQIWATSRNAAKNRVLCRILTTRWLWKKTVWKFKFSKKIWKIKTFQKIVMHPCKASKEMYARQISAETVHISLFSAPNVICAKYWVFANNGLDLDFRHYKMHQFFFLNCSSLGAL